MQRVARSGLFDAADYRRANRLDGLSDLRTLWHWARHGNAEGRIASSIPLSEWLLPKVTSGELPADTARQIVSLADPEQLQLASHEAKLNTAEFDTLCALLDNDFAGAAGELSKTNGLFYLRTLHKSLRTVPLSNDLTEAYARISGDPKLTLDSLSVVDQSRYINIAVAAGASWAEQVELANRTRRADAGMLSRVMNSRFNQCDPGKDLRLFLHAALSNAKSLDQFVQIQYGPEGWTATETTIGASKRQMLIFAPAANVWLRQTEPEQLMLNAFSLIVESCLRQGIALIPLMPVFTRDITNVAFPELPAVSYHTFASGRPDILHYKETSLKGFFAFDAMGYSGASTYAVSQNRPVKTNEGVEALSKMKALYQNSQLTKYVQGKGQVQPHLPDHFMFLPLQIPDDSVCRWQHLTSLQLLEILAARAKATNFPLVVKRHPHDGSRATTQALAKLENAPDIFISEAPIQDLIHAAACIITANSGVGFEALLCGKPVFTTGLSEYAHAAEYRPDAASLNSALNAFIDRNYEFDSSRGYDFIGRYLSQHVFEAHDSPSSQEESLAPHLSEFLNSVG